MKKITALLLVAVTLLISLVSCGNTVSDSGAARIVTTSHVVGDWIENIVGDSSDSQIILLADKGKDMHNFQPSATDIMEIKRADVIVYIGGESDMWIENAFNDIDREKVSTLRLLDFVEHIEHGDCVGEEHHHEGADEHIWLSFENAKNCVIKISETLSARKQENAAAYEENSVKYLSALEAVAEEYRKAVDSAAHKALVFADRYPFGYLVEELGVECYAAFPGCSSETVASFDTVISLANKVDELGLPCVLVIADSSDSIAKTVVENTKTKNAQILTLDSMQVYKGEGNTDYLDVMKNNLEVLKTAFGCK